MFARTEADRAILCTRTSNDRVKLTKTGARAPRLTDRVVAPAHDLAASTARVDVQSGAPLRPCRDVPEK